jgi:hypothetical protein
LKFIFISQLIERINTMGQERAYEAVAVTTIIEPQLATGTAYNGASTTGTVLDTLGYDGCTIVLSKGTFVGSTKCTVGVYVNATASAAAAEGAYAVTGAVFDDVTTSNDDCTELGYVKCFRESRYLHVKTVVSGGNTAPISAIAILDRFQKHPLLSSASPALRFNVDASA